MTDQSPRITRRVALTGAALIGGLPLLAAASGATAAGTIPKTSAKYQDTPNNGRECDSCSYYVAGASADAPGLCKIVAGPVSPKGWCALYAPKS